MSQPTMSQSPLSQPPFTQPVSRPMDDRRRRKFNVWPILALIAIGLVLMWHFGVFKSRPQIVLVTSGDTAYWNRVIAGAQSAADVYDAKLTVMRPKTVLSDQNDILSKLVNQTADGVAISPIDPMSQAGLLSQIADHAPLITFDSDSPVSQRLCFVGTDQYEAGRIAGSMVRQILPNGGTVAICLGNPDKENSRLRRQGVIDEVLDRAYDKVQTIDPADQVVKNDKYTILPTIVDNSDVKAAVDLAAKVVSDHPDVSCFVGLLGYSTPAIVQALEQTGKTGKIKVVGFDVNDATIAGIKSGAVYGTIMQDQFGLGFQTVRLLAENSQGNHSGFPMFQRQTLPVEKIVLANIDEASRQMSAGAAASTADGASPKGVMTPTAPPTTAASE